VPPLRALVTVALALAVPPLAAAAAAGPLADYATLWRGDFAVAGAAAPAGGRFAADVASWELAAGEWRGAAPLADGRVAGCVFRGHGRFRLELPDARERAAFARLAESAERDPVELEFDALVVRAADGTCERLAGAPAPPFAPDPLAEERRRTWIERAFFDVEAAALRALSGDAPGWLVAEMRTREHGWLLYTFDPSLGEEIGLARFDPGEGVYEPWVSLDRAADRRADGRPGRPAARQFDLLDVDLRADLRRPSRFPKEGLAGVVPRRGRFAATLRFRPLRPELTTLQLELDPWCEVVAVRDERGRELAFVRDAVGKRRSGLPDDVWDDGLLVLLEAPVGAAERALDVVWERDLLNYLPGRAAYPGERDGHGDPHTASLAVTALPRHELRGMGELVEERDDAEGRLRRWRVDRPVRAVTFAFAERFAAERVTRAGQPDVVALAARGGARRLRRVAEQIADAWAFFARRFGPGPAVEELQVVGVVGDHGQAFEGFLHLAEASFDAERAGATELFRAHETAHQWWGQLVGRASWRDLWLTEAFAEYSALLFVEASLPDGPALYREAIGAFAAAAFGEGRPSRFDRELAPPVAPRRWRRIGPIAFGSRAATVDVGSAYRTQIYRKGALVLHMLRHLLRRQSGDDELFFAVLADFARDFRGRDAATEDFVATLARRAPGDWEQFVAQWVDETAIPEWEWTWRPAATEAGAPAVAIELAQRSAPPGFRMPVDVEIETAGGGRERVTIVVDAGASQRFTLPANGAPRRVTLDPDAGVLARRRQR